MSLIIKELLQIGESALSKAGCMDPQIDAKLIMMFLLSMDKQQLFIKSPALLDEKTCEAYFKLIDIRAGGKPVQYITGEQEFMGISFKVNENVLIPRQDTETLVEEVIRVVQDKAAQKKESRGSEQILDLCCGSGAIGVSLCKYLKDVKVTAADISDKALSVAKANAKSADVSKRMKFVESDLFGSFRKGIGGAKFHIVVSNPPYVKRDVIPTLQREIFEHEPMIALDGGEDGLKFYRRILAEVSDYLRPEGMLFLEFGHDQGASVCMLARDMERFENIEVVKDLAGHDRIMKCSLKTLLKTSRDSRKSKK